MAALIDSGDKLIREKEKVDNMYELLFENATEGDRTKTSKHCIP